MPLPIALGGRSISAQTLEKSCGRPDLTDDGKRQLDPDVLYETVGWAVCPDHEWSARVICTYYDLWVASDDGKARDCTMVEVRIQLSPLARPLSTDYRETIHHLKLLEEGATPSKELLRHQPQVLVSSDRRNLAVLLSHPHQHSTALVIFQLRRPRADLSAAATTKKQIPLPAYIQRVGNDVARAASVMARDPPAVATHPRFVAVWGITTMACLPPIVNPSVFLAVRCDGSFVWLDARSGLAVATGHCTFTAEQQEQWLPISTLRLSPSSQMNHGRGVMLTRFGSAVAVQWELQAISNRAHHPTFARVDTGVVISQQVPGAPENPTMSSPRHPDGDRNPNAPMRKVARSKSSDLADMISPMRRIALSKSSDLAEMFSPAMRNVLRLPPKQVEGREEQGEEHATKSTLNSRILKEVQKKTLSRGVHLDDEPGTCDTKKLTLPSMAIEEARERRRIIVRSNDETLQQAETLTRQMALRVLSVVKDGAVRDAQYTRLPSVLCLLFDQGVEPGKVAEILTFKEDGSIELVVDFVLTKEQVMHACQVQTSPHENLIQPEIQVSPQNRCGLDYDPSSDTFAISTIYEDSSKWVGCLWNWRHNILGWTIQQSLPSCLWNNVCWSRFYFCQYPQKANCLAMLESTYTKEQHIHVRKETVAAGILSPRSQNGDPQLEPNYMVLASDSIHFPAVIPAAGSEKFELDWKVAALPTNYRNTYGPPGLAACGRRYGHSIAVAASGGVCILDRHLRWRQFGTPSEEKSFQVVAMAWWEGTSNDLGPEELNEDLLIAIIQSDNGRQYLSCWSSKRLDLAHQLLVDYLSTSNDDGQTKLSWGIPLEKGSDRATLSLLSEPHSNKRRGVVLVASQENGGVDFVYQVYRLQVSKSSLNLGFTERNLEDMPYKVIVHELLHGNVVPESNSAGALWSTFLAGASFDFDLELENCGIVKEEEMVATLGVVRCPGGLDTIALIGAKTFLASVLNDGETTNISMSDVVCGRHTEPSTECHELDAFVWKVEFLTGETYCWIVPYRSNGEENDSRTRAYMLDQDINRPKCLRPPTLVGQHEKWKSAFGVLCYIGTNSSWMQQSSFGTQSDAMLGPVPDSGFGCILRAGQHSRMVQRPSLGGDPQKEIDTDLYEPSPFQMTPPVFVPSLYSLLIETAYLRMELQTVDEGVLGGTSKLLRDGFKRLGSIEKHIDFRLRECQNKDASMMALRLLVFRSLETLSQFDRKHRRLQTDVSRSNLVLSLTLFTGIVDTVRRHSTDLQFACLFLEVGRQIEPNLLAYLFPLPPTHSVISQNSAPHDQPRNVVLIERDTWDRHNARTVTELFRICVQTGSLRASSSCLPLFSSRSHSQQRVGLLLESAVNAFVDNIENSQSNYDHTVEERGVMGDLFRFGVRVEDADEMDKGVLARVCQNDGTQESMYGTLSESAPQFSLGSSDYFSTDDEGGSERDKIRASVTSLVCLGGGRRSSSILSVLGSMFDGGKSKESEEAIRRAANSFIESKRELASMDLLHYSFDEDSCSGASLQEDESNTGSTSNASSDGNCRPSATFPPRESQRAAGSVATVAGGAIVKILRTLRTEHRWSALGALARMLVQSSSQFPFGPVLSKAINQIGPSEIQDLVSNLSDEHGDADSSMLECFLKGEVDRCDFQLRSTQDALWIVDLSILLLDRLVETRDCPREILSALVLIGVVTGHCSGKTAALIQSLGEANYMTRSLKIVGS